MFHRRRRFNLNLPKPRYREVPVSFLRRGLAFVIDLFIINLFLFGPFRGVFTKLLPPEETAGLDMAALQALLESNQFLMTIVLMLSFAAGGIALLYFSILQYKFNKTIGMHLLRINLVSEQKHKQKLVSLWQCIVRNIFIIPVFPFFLFWVIDPLFLLFNPKHQRLLEKWSKTKLTQTMIM